MLTAARSTGLGDYEANCLSFNIIDIAGNDRSRIIERLQASRPLAGLDEDRANFKALADGRQGGAMPGRRPVDPAAPTPSDADNGNRFTIYEDSE